MLQSEVTNFEKVFSEICEANRVWGTSNDRPENFSYNYKAEIKQQMVSELQSIANYPHDVISGTLEKHNLSTGPDMQPKLLRWVKYTWIFKKEKEIIYY